MPTDLDKKSASPKLAKNQKKAPVPKVPTYKKEAELISQGYAIVAGVDEVGRGPLAGPVMAAAVVLPNIRLDWYNDVRDSKLLTAAKRALLAPVIRKEALAFGIGMATVSEIDKFGIAKATMWATVRSLRRLTLKPAYILTDNVRLKGIGLPHTAVPEGDTVCLSIAAASVIAKVARDEIMTEMDERYPEYGFAQHKGYATAEHMERIYKIGVCDIHRKTFFPAKEILMRPMFED